VYIIPCYHGNGSLGGDLCLSDDDNGEVKNGEDEHDGAGELHQPLLGQFPGISRHFSAFPESSKPVPVIEKRGAPDKRDKTKIKQKVPLSNSFIVAHLWKSIPMQASATEKQLFSFAISGDSVRCFQSLEASDIYTIVSERMIFSL